MAWIRVGRGMDCPICGGDSWCQLTNNEPYLVLCMRVMSAKEKRMDHGTGWIHHRDSIPDGAQMRAPEPEQPKLSSEELTAIAKRCFEHERAAEYRRRVAGLLQVTPESLEALRVGWGLDSGTGAEFSSWPERDWRGRIVGINRRYADGAKRRWHGGSAGLTYAHGWSRYPGVLFVVEGGSDVSAALAAGLAAIGRPSSLGGGEWIARMVSQRWIGRAIVVIAERDERPERRGDPQFPQCPVDCRGCGRCFPGKFGAERVAARLALSAPELVKWCFPPEGCKDFREAFTKGKLWPELIQSL